VSTYSYDMAGQMTDITHKNGGTVLARSAYTLDVLGRRTAQTREDGITETYGYDTTSQLTSADYGTSSPLAKASAPVTRETFAYDALGNRTQVGRVVPNAPSTTTAYTANALNQYTQVAGVAFAYDANGNLTHDGKQTYRYDAQNRLLGVEPVAPTTGAIRAEFAYDARNRCVLRRYHSLGSQGQWVLKAGGSRALTYDITWNLLAERAPDGARIGEYIHGQRTDEVLVSNLKSQVLYPLADGLGSVVALTDNVGKVSERFRYSAYGQPINLSATLQTATVSASGYRFLFTGREWLGSISLNEHRNRYLSLNSGRWLSTDPLGLRDDQNNYAYVKNGSTLFTDRFGLCRDMVGMNACAGDVVINFGVGSIPYIGTGLALAGIEFSFLQALRNGTNDWIKDEEAVGVTGQVVDQTKSDAERIFSELGGEAKLACYDSHADRLGSKTRTARSKLSAAKTIASFLGPVGKILTFGDTALEMQDCYSNYCL
jgi:RHS repeat-associated protein